jgi:hypothetical protein
MTTHAEKVEQIARAVRAASRDGRPVEFAKRSPAPPSRG